MHGKFLNVEKYSVRCLESQVTTSKEANKKIDNVAVISPKTPKIRTLATEHAHQKFEQDVMDTKL